MNIYLKSPQRLLGTFLGIIMVMTIMKQRVSKVSTHKKCFEKMYKIYGKDTGKEFTNE